MDVHGNSSILLNVSVVGQKVLFVICMFLSVFILEFWYFLGLSLMSLDESFLLSKVEKNL